MEKKIIQLHRRQRRGRLAIYGILALLVIIIVAIVALTQRISQEQAFQSQSYAQYSVNNNDINENINNSERLTDINQDLTDQTTSIQLGCWAYVKPSPVPGEDYCESSVYCTSDCRCPKDQQDLMKVQCPLSQSPYAPPSCYWRECKEKAVKLCKGCSRSSTPIPTKTNIPTTTQSPTPISPTPVGLNECQKHIIKIAKAQRCGAYQLNCKPCPDDPSKQCTYNNRTGYYFYYQCPDSSNWYFVNCFSLDQTCYNEMFSFCKCP